MDFTPYYTDGVSWGYVEKVAPFRRSNDLLLLGEISSIHIIPDNLHTFATSSLAYHICLTELGPDPMAYGGFIETNGRCRGTREESRK